MTANQVQPTQPTEEEIRLYQLYQALQHDAEPPSLDDYSITGEWGDVAVEIHAARIEKGVPGVKAYVKNLQKIKTDHYKRLVNLFSSYTPGQDQSPQVGILLSDVQPEEVHYLWKPRIALGKIAMFDGDPGLGKSNILLNIASRVSRGKEMPDGAPGIMGGVVLITPEDGLADTIQPRLTRAGADLTKIVSIGTIATTDAKTGYTYNRPFGLPDDLELLEEAMKRVSAKLVIIDPVMSILGGKDTYKDNEVRSILAPVQMLIEKAGAACILVRHLTKSRGDNPLYAGGGSIAFIGLARLGLMVMKDPLDEEKCVFVHIKSNIGKLAVPLSYSIVSDEQEGDDRPYVYWQGESQHTLQDLMSQSTSKPGSGRLDILRILKERYPEALTPQELQEALPEMTINNLRVTLKRMAEDGQIEKSARGLYCAHSA